MDRLSVMMQAAMGAAKEIAKLSDVVPCHLLFETQDDARGMADLDIGPGPVQAAAARQVAAMVRAERVVLVVEGWACSGPVDDPDLARVARGELEVRELPASKRFDLLLIHGEEKNGREIEQQFVIHRDAPGLVRLERFTPPSPVSSEFSPLLCHASVN